MLSHTSIFAGAKIHYDILGISSSRIFSLLLGLGQDAEVTTRIADTKLQSVVPSFCNAK